MPWSTAGTPPSGCSRCWRTTSPSSRSAGPPSATGVPSSFLDASIRGRGPSTVTDAVAEFESARHRFRLALVAVGVDKRAVGTDIGTALAFFAAAGSRYLQEARTKWPELREPVHPEGRRR